MDPLNVAVIGCGIAGPRLHMPILSRHSGATLVAICDPNEWRLESAASEFAPVATCTDHRELIDRGDIDSVHVCTPPDLHEPIATDFLEASIPVLVEKPMTTSTESARRLIDVAEETGTTLSVVHNQRFEPQVRRALERVARGEIGDVLSVTLHYSEDIDVTRSPREWAFEMPGAEIGEGIPHQVYLPLAFVDGLGESIDVKTYTYGEYSEEVDFDTVVIETTDEAGIRPVTIEVTTNSISTSCLHVFGTRGSLAVPRGMIGSYVTTHENVVRNSVAHGVQHVANAIRKASDAVARAGYALRGDSRSMRNDGHYVQIDRHIDCVRSGTEPPVTPEEGYDTVCVLEELYRVADREAN